MHACRSTLEDPTLLIAGGGHHVPGRDDDTAAKLAELEEWFGATFPGTEVAYRWAAQDYTSADKVPFVGKAGHGADHLWTATAFGAWGMTNGIAAGLLLTELIEGRRPDGADLFDATRTIATDGLTTTVKENLAIAKELLGGSLRPGEGMDPQDLKTGEGAVIHLHGHKVACARDGDGELHMRSARCTHLGCVVAWNSAEASWDCPCHGSRFAPNGDVLSGPATKPLAEVDAADG